ncbi:hypothetical protein BDV18DRAFT_57736 [Aspergillus unguis]
MLANLTGSILGHSKAGLVFYNMLHILLSLGRIFWFTNTWVHGVWLYLVFYCLRENTPGMRMAYTCFCSHPALFCSCWVITVTVGYGYGYLDSSKGVGTASRPFHSKLYPELDSDWNGWIPSMAGSPGFFSYR